MILRVPMARVPNQNIGEFNELLVPPDDTDSTERPPTSAAGTSLERMRT